MYSVKRMVIDSVYESFSPRVEHRSENFGLSLMSQTGEKVKICILDSGTPAHKGMNNNAESINFTKDNIIDNIGHATMVSGIIGCNDNNLVGLAPNASLYFAKIIHDNCKARFDSIIAGILWAVIKGVDIILLPLSTNISHISLEMAVKKAYDSNICVISSAGNNGEIEYPAVYDTVLSVGAYDISNKIASFSAEGDFNVTGCLIETAYLNNQYAVVSGTSIAAGIAAAMCARLIEKHKNSNTNYTVKDLYKQMQNLYL